MNISIDYPTWAVALAVVFVVAWLIQIVLQFVVWQRPLRHAKKAAPLAGGGEQPGVSVLVYSSNASEALARTLPALLDQNYPEFEVIVLDDCSRDETLDVVMSFEQQSNRLFLTHIDERARAMSHRKLGILLGTKAAHYDIILTTHAECMPASPDWIAGMVRHFSNPATEVVLGPVVYERRQSFLSRFCRFDLFERLLMLMGLTLSVRPYAGWGQNLAFRKSTFYANRSQGFQRHLKIQPGEDDLFVGDVARDGNVAVEFQADTVMTDQSSPLFLCWGMERLNRGFTSRLYAMGPVFVKALEQVTRYLTVLPGLGLLAYALYIIIGVPGSHPMAWTVFGVTLGLLLVRVGLMIYTYLASAKLLKQRPLTSWALLLDLYTPLVDAWFRVKALIFRKRFSVGRVGIQ